MRIRRNLAILCVTAAVAALAVPLAWELFQPRSAQFASVHPVEPLPPLATLDESSVFNAGDASALDAFPGVGEVIARRIIETREALGGFLFPEDLMLVKGVGERTFAGIMEAADP